jgi:hypothetical protein
MTRVLQKNLKKYYVPKSGEFQGVLAHLRVFNRRSAVEGIQVDLRLQSYRSGSDSDRTQPGVITGRKVDPVSAHYL